MKINSKNLRYDKDSTDECCPKCGNHFYIKGRKCYSCGYE